MTWETFELIIKQYGYFAILIGTFLEGETIVLVAGFLAFEKYLSLYGIIACAFVGSLCGDQLAFYIGRYKGNALFAKKPKWKARADYVVKKMEKHQKKLMLTFRFFYGLRNVTPFAIGMSSVRPRTFFFYNMIGAAVWAVSFGVAGYVFGAAMEKVLKEVKQYEMYILVGLIVAAFLYWLYRHIKKRNAAAYVDNNGQSESSVSAEEPAPAPDTPSDKH